MQKKFEPWYKTVDVLPVLKTVHLHKLTTVSIHKICSVFLLAIYIFVSY